MELVENVCNSNQCSAKVKLSSIRTDNRGLAWEALDQLRQRDGFKKLFLSRPKNINAIPLSTRKGFWEVTFEYSYRLASHAD